MTGKRLDRVLIDDPPATAVPNEIHADLARVKALFQARSIAGLTGASMPDPATFRRKPS